MGGRILIADDTVTDRIALKARLATARHTVVQARHGEELASVMLSTPPDVVLMDIDFPGGGIAACRALKAHARLREVPVVLYGAADDTAARVAALEAGAEECLADLPGETLLLALLRNLIRRNAERSELMRRHALHGNDALAEAPTSFQARPRITLVPASAADGPSWRAGVEAAFPAKVTLATATTMLEAASASDAYVIAFAPGNPGTALGLVAELRARPATRHAIVLLHHPGPASDIAEMALDFGADGILRGPFSPDELAARLQRLLARKRETDRLRAQVEDQLDKALRDPLTGLFNRRYVDGYLARLSRERATGGNACALLLIDLDHFKSVNDRFGHLAGDDVLVETARRLRTTLREIDLLARIGGEEFLVILRGADAATARDTADRLRRAIGGRPVPVRSGGDEVSVTASVGVALCAGSHTNHRELFDQADRALYASKAAGRNRVTFASERSAA
ncbi:diguanylate cyclase [Maritimibacter sp. UBA3975]|uniref:diguanylate cyclase n=1 Tax=Maritimibacter sp. UBA3975 TaxID=1946833 RepID=UPI000C0A93EA|nr:diguanylate cyclase [Maritimibacter sp. UBA3975]MAM62835.1 diguanylate cyclase response regulator [Maritimibacter sp.]|tara:strand:- start:1493 stop:2863 length:1371 start_codon:yes stop_codon:yes gene_type:complete